MPTTVTVGTVAAETDGVGDVDLLFKADIECIGLIRGGFVVAKEAAQLFFVVHYSMQVLP